MRVKLLVLAGTATLALAGAGQALAAGMQGTVVGKERARHALVITGSNAIARTVRVGGAYRLRPGARVSVQTGRLRDGTHRATAVRVVGRSARARVQGTVLKARRSGYLLSAGKSVLAIRYRSGHRFSSSSGSPRRGDQIVVRLSISRSGALTQQGPAQTVAHGARLEVVGNLSALTPSTATTPGSVTITVELPGPPPTSTPITCVVPAGFPDLSAFSVGQLVEMVCTLPLVNGQFTLEELAIPGQRGVEDEDEDEDEVEGEVTALTPATATATGSVTVGSVTCTIPAGFDTMGIQVGDEVEIECEAGILTEIEEEDDDEDDDDD
jgi:hypothetical protein